MGLEPTHAWIKGIGFGRIEMRKNLIHRWGYDILELRSIDDMEAGRELPLTEAFVKITELRNRRRNAEV